MGVFLWKHRQATITRTCTNRDRKHLIRKGREGKRREGKATGRGREGRIQAFKNGESDHPQLTCTPHKTVRPYSHPTATTIRP